jgi:hypothetical protein
MMAIPPAWVSRATASLLSVALVVYAGCSDSIREAQKAKEDRQLAALVQKATVDDRVRPGCNGPYEATWTAVFAHPNDAGLIVRENCQAYPGCTSEVVRGGLSGVNVADDADVQNVVANAAYAQPPTAERYMKIIDTAFSVVPYQSDAIKAGIEEVQATIIDLKTGKPLKEPLIVFRQKNDLPWPVRRYHPPYYVYVNPNAARRGYGYSK